MPQRSSSKVTLAGLGVLVFCTFGNEFAEQVVEHSLGVGVKVRAKSRREPALTILIKIILMRMQI